MFGNRHWHRAGWALLSVLVLTLLMALWLEPKALYFLIPLSLMWAGIMGAYLHRLHQSLAHLSEQVDALLYTNEPPHFEDMEEGSLYILQSEIQKLAIRLKEQADLLQSDKLVLQRAMEDIFHQLRTPLTVLFIQLELLKEEGLSGSERQALIRQISRACHRMQWLVESLLTMSKIDAGTILFQKKPVLLARLVEDALATFAIGLELQEIRVEKAVDDEAFLGDRKWSREAIENLIKNAMEHLPKGGQLKISAQENPVFTELVIEDNGPGFDPSDLPFLFKRFYKGKNAGENSIGIGLALSQKIIAAQNGTIQAENRLEGGARFRIRFYKKII